LNHLLQGSFDAVEKFRKHTWPEPQSRDVADFDGLSARIVISLAGGQTTVCLPFQIAISDVTSKRIDHSLVTY
jgi:hypothetical protein